MYHGDIRLGDTIDIKFSTRSFSTGAPTTLAGTPSVAAYPGNSTTEITAGITLTVDFDTRTGLHNVRVVATSGNGYATATNYTLVITAGTVGGTSVVGECIGSFSIEARSALMPATAARTLVVDAAGLADANMVKCGPTGSGTAQTARDLGGQLDVAVSTRLAPTTAGRTLDVSATGEAGVDWANVGSPTTAVNLSGTTISTSQAIASVSGAVGSVTGAVGSVTGSVGSVTGAVGSVTAAVTVGTNNDKTGYALTAAYDLAKTAAQAGDAMTLSAAERNAVADAFLARNVAGGSSAGRLVKEAFYVLRNKVDVQAGTMTVYGTDDVTSAFTAAVTTAAGNPITTIDPA